MIDNEEYFNRLGREIIRLLDARTEDGFVFRVDMRLRPFGESGPLVVSLASLDDYLQQHGRDWERYAWIKARAIVGADAYSSANEEFVRPFVYRRYLDFGVFESLREMKAMIAREVARRDLEQDLKLGMGGIREIEFIVQSMQLVRGGSDRRLQNPALLEVMPLLAGSKLLSPAEISQLRDAYLVLRKAENALQMIRDEQTHSIPSDPADRARLCLNLGVADWPSGAARIDAARQTVARQFEALLFGTLGHAASIRRNGVELARFRESRHRGRTGRVRISRARDSGGRGPVGILSPRGSLSQAGRGRPASSARHTGAFAEGGRTASISRNRGAAGAAGARCNRRSLILSGAVEGTAAGSGSSDRRLRDQRIPSASDRRFSAAARRIDRRQGVR